MFNLVMFLFFTLALTARSQEVLGDYKWSDLAQRGELRAGAPMMLDGREALKIENTNAARWQVTLLEIKHPKLTANVYELSGEIRYDGVAGDGYLEMLNIFPPPKAGMPPAQYFSRTLGDSGPMRKITGTSDWREFTLLFDRTAATGAPTSLQVNLILPGRGTVYLSNAKLAQLPGVKLGNALYPNSWWSPWRAGWIFGWGGAIIGCLGGLCGFLGALGRARRLVMGMLVLMIMLGLVAAIAGVVAVVQHQPYAVWYPLILCGILLGTICPYNLRVLRRNYEAKELRRMAALDVSGAA